MSMQDDDGLHLEDRTDSDAPSAPTSVVRRGSGADSGSDAPLPVHRRHHSQPPPETLNQFRRAALQEPVDRPGTPPRKLPIATLSARLNQNEGHQPMRRSRSKQSGLGVPVSVKATGFGGHPSAGESSS